MQDIYEIYIRSSSMYMIMNSYNHLRDNNTDKNIINNKEIEVIIITLLQSY